MTTIHSYTNDQNVLDQLHKDMRRARAAALSMIPTTTGAARAVGEVLPELKGKLDGSSIRVPTPNVSVVDLKFLPSRPTTKDEVNSLLKAAAENGPLKGILGYSDEPLVSIDYNGDPRSSTVDSLETAVIDGKLVRVLSWYDNEWGFSNRMIDTSKVVAGPALTAQYSVRVERSRDTWRQPFSTSGRAEAILEPALRAVEGLEPNGKAGLWRDHSRRLTIWATSRARRSLSART